MPGRIAHQVVEHVHFHVRLLQDWRWRNRLSPNQIKNKVWELGGLQRTQTRKIWNLCLKRLNRNYRERLPLRGIYFVIFILHQHARGLFWIANYPQIPRAISMISIHKIWSVVLRQSHILFTATGWTGNWPAPWPFGTGDFGLNISISKRWVDLFPANGVWFTLIMSNQVAVLKIW